MKNFLVSAAGTVAGIIVFIGGTIFFFGILAALSGDGGVNVNSNSILHLKLNKAFVERASKDDPFANLPATFGGTGPKVGLLEFKEVLSYAKNDERIKGIYLDMGGVSSGFASLEVARRALADFKESGKFIIAYGEVITEGAYYLASVADEIYVYPQGGLEFNGLHSEIMFYTGMFEKVGVEAKVFRVGKFKSAVEPFMRKEMSDANHIQTNSFLNSMYDHYLTEVAASRNKTYEELKMVSDSMLVQNAKDAVTHGLIDGTKYFDEVETLLKEKVGMKGQDQPNFITYEKYALSPMPSESHSDKVAVIIAKGDIIDGKSSAESMGGATISKAIRNARLDKNVKAIVLRVNSPGGSALASDVMWREVMLTKGEKPIIASMGDYAASGGYYISMGCDKIYAEPNTITGSIGVFGLMFNTQKLMEDKLGLTYDRETTGAYSDLGNMNREMSDVEAQIIQRGVDEIYEDFTKKAAEGRGMHHDSLKAVASGRVWSGTEALRENLVDEMGGLDDAIKYAAEQANIEEYSVAYYPKEKDFAEQLLENLGAETTAYQEQQMFGDFSDQIRKIKNLKKMKGVQARMPYDLKVIE